MHVHCSRCAKGAGASNWLEEHSLMATPALPLPSTPPLTHRRPLQLPFPVLGAEHGEGLQSRGRSLDHGEGGS